MVSSKDSNRILTRKLRKVEGQVENARITFPDDLTWTVGKMAELVTGIYQHATASPLPKGHHIAEVQLIPTGESVNGEPLVDVHVTVCNGSHDH